MGTKLKNFQWQKPEVVPAFVQGKDAEAVYKSISRMNLGWCDYQAETQTLRGSSPFIAARIDSLLRPYGIRVANLRDLSRPEVMGMVKGRYYIDTPAFVLRTIEDSNSKNLSLIKRIAEEVEKVNGKLELPVIVTGFDVISLEEDKTGYGLDLVARDDFNAVHDNRLKGEYNLKRFSEVDELGLPKFDDNGSRTWYARQKGVSRLSLNRNLDLISDSGYLAGSDDTGRVALISGEATQKKSSR
jgi:hypothetical protein